MGKDRSRKGGKLRSSSGRFIKLPLDIVHSAAWRHLRAPARALWIDLRSMFNGANNGRISPTFSVMKRMGWTSKDTLARALQELIDHGFIQYTRKASPNVFHRASLIRFTDEFTPGHDDEHVSQVIATHDYRSCTPNSLKKTPTPGWRGGSAPADGEKRPRHLGIVMAQLTRPPGNDIQLTEEKNMLTDKDLQDFDGGKGRSPFDGDDLDVANPYRAGGRETSTDIAAGQTPDLKPAGRLVVDYLSIHGPTGTWELRHACGRLVNVKGTVEAANVALEKFGDPRRVVQLGGSGGMWAVTTAGRSH